MRVAVIGIGHMGKGIARNVVLPKPISSAAAASLDNSKTILNIFDRDPQKLYDFWQALPADAASRVKVCTSPAMAALAADFVLMSLPSADATRHALFDVDGGVATVAAVAGQSRGKENLLVVDHGTFSKGFALDCHSAAKERGLSYVDAPVSGGPQVTGFCGNT
jgi:3-hydroxyisobutyrate dehydrogenase-like beta-hydroxyacid dehydrogenase